MSENDELEEMTEAEEQAARDARLERFFYSAVGRAYVSLFGLDSPVAGAVLDGLKEYDDAKYLELDMSPASRLDEVLAAHPATG